MCLTSSNVVSTLVSLFEITLAGVDLGRVDWVSSISLF